MNPQESTCGCECHDLLEAPRHCIACDADTDPEVTHLFAPPNPSAVRISPDECGHTWDSIHYVSEGFDTIVCPRCRKTLGIKAVEFHDNNVTFIFPEA